MVRPISASSGTPPFWRRAWALSPIGSFFESIWWKFKNHSKTATYKEIRMPAPKKEGSLRRPKLAVPSLGLNFSRVRVLFKNNLKIKQIYNRMHARRQKREVPEEAKIGRTIITFVFFTCALGAPMTAWRPPDAVSAAEPLCSHVKDHPGLGSPNSLKLYSQSCWWQLQ